MIREIAKKEILDQLMSLRMTITFLLVTILLAASSLLFNAEFKRRLGDYDIEVNRNLANLARWASSDYSLFETFSYSRQLIYRRPNPLGFVCEAHDKDLPNTFQLNAFKLERSDYTLRSNPTLWRFDNLDWAFIVSVILSFAAIVLVYDSINGEKQRGTLRLIISQPIGRERVLLGKYVGSMTVLLMPLVLGVLLSMALLNRGGGIRMDADFLMKVLLSLALSIVYISAFVLLALFLSARTREPVVSLVTGLLIWVMLVIVIPAIANLTARGVIKLPMQDRVLEDARRAEEEALENYDRQHPHPGEWGFSYNWSPGEPLLRSFEVARAWGRVVQGYQDSLLSQVELGRKCARFSPSALFTQTLESVTGSGIPDFERFLKSARQYRESLGTYLDQKFPLQKDIPLDRNTTDKIVSGVKLDFASIPKFTDRQAPLREAVGSALFGGGLLMLINLVLFVAAHISFLRYDVR